MNFQNGTANNAANADASNSRNNAGGNNPNVFVSVMLTSGDVHA